MALDCTSSNVSDEWKLLTGSSPFFISAGVFFLFCLEAGGKWVVVYPRAWINLFFPCICFSHARKSSRHFSLVFFFYFVIFEQRFNDRSWSRKFFWRLVFVCFVPIGGFFERPPPRVSLGRCLCTFPPPNVSFIFFLLCHPIIDDYTQSAVGSMTRNRHINEAKNLSAAGVWKRIFLEKVERYSGAATK